MRNLLRLRHFIDDLRSLFEHSISQTTFFWGGEAIGFPKEEKIKDGFTVNKRLTVNHIFGSLVALR